MTTLRLLTLSCLISAIGWFMPAIAQAKPDLQSQIRLGNAIVYRDHVAPDTFYYLHIKRELARAVEKPEFLFSINRYIGSEITRDRGEFWARGVIKFATQIDSSSDDYGTLLINLQKEFGVRIKLEAMPVVNEHNRLQFVSIDEADSVHPNSQPLSAEFDLTRSSDKAIGRVSSETKRRYSLRLNDREADLYWQQFHNERLSVSLSYGWDIDGVVMDENGAWMPHQRAVNDTLAISVSPADHPDLFKRNELWQRVNIAHSGIKILCYDFLDEVQPDLYYTLIELRFETLTGRQYSKQIKFVADSEQFETEVEFELANDIKEGFEYRVRRLTIDGDVTQGPWVKHDKAWLDISLPVTKERSDVESITQ